MENGCKDDREKTKKKVSDLVVNGKKKTDDKAKAEVFGQHFAKVSSDDNLEEPFSSIKNIMEHGIKEKIEQTKMNEEESGINSSIKSIRTGSRY